MLEDAMSLGRLANNYNQSVLHRMEGNRNRRTRALISPKFQYFS